MEIPVSYVVNDTNRRQAVQIPYAEWKQLKQQLLDAEMQFWTIQELDKRIRTTDLALALAEIQEIEAGCQPTKTVFEAFSDCVGSTNQSPAPTGIPILTTDFFCRQAEPLLEKHPLLKQDLLTLPQSALGGSATRIGEDHLSIGWIFIHAKKKQQPAMRVEVHFICHYHPATTQANPLYLAAIYDKSERKLVDPPFTQFI
jgi:hypothetical protein